MKKSLQCTLAAAAIAAGVVSVPSYALTVGDRVGEPFNGAAGRVISLDSRARWINVDFGEVVQFVHNGRAFQWMFDGMANNVRLSEIAPPDFSAPPTQPGDAI